MGSYNAWAITSLDIDASEEEIAEEFLRIQERICWKDNETRTYEAFCACMNRIPYRDAMRQHQKVADDLWENTVADLVKVEDFRANYKYPPVHGYNYTSQENQNAWRELKELLDATIKSHALYLKGDPSCSCKDGTYIRNGSTEEFCYRIRLVEDSDPRWYFPYDGKEDTERYFRTCADLIKMRSSGLWYPFVDTIVRQESTSLRKLRNNAYYYDNLNEESAYNYLHNIYGEMDWFFRLDYLLNADMNKNATVINFVCVWVGNAC